MEVLKSLQSLHFGRLPRLPRPLRRLVSGPPGDQQPTNDMSIRAQDAFSVLIHNMVIMGLCWVIAGSVLVFSWSFLAHAS